MNEYGPFEEIVKAAGALIAAATAIALSWRGQLPWGSWEEELPQGPQRVASLVVAVLIGVLWFFAEPEDTGFLARLAIGLAVAAFVLVVIYTYLVSQYTFTKVVVALDGEDRVPEERKVIGGFRLTEHARTTIAKQRESVQGFFAGTAYNAESVWTRRSLSLAKLTFVVTYICLVACGTLALSAAALLVGFKQ
jgi:hypothetical protein